MTESYFLKSSHIGFRAWSLDDMDLAVELWDDPEVTKFIGGPFSKTQIHGKLVTEMKILRLHHIQYWPIFLLETGKFIGCCGLRPYQPTERIYEIGFHIKSSMWNKRYASEAAQAVIEYAFGPFKATALFAGHHPENDASKYLLEKLGFHYAYEEYYEPTRQYHPSYMLPNAKR
jgi:ribosomal-protein-alanine N-acetyltransferase